jgi:DUF971 family protein
LKGIVGQRMSEPNSIHTISHSTRTIPEFAILSVDPVGNYAVRLGFDHMHPTGIFSWAFLHEIGRDSGQRFQSYLDDLAAKDLDRDKPGAR